MIKDKQIANRISNEEHRGYWSVNDSIYFFNKFEALRYASSLKSTSVKYHYFDDFYNNLNWSIEPTETLDNLYKLRAQNLRDKYDYLVLSFSGGADSTNVLNTFVKNGIHLDEVFTSYPKSLMEKIHTKFDKNQRFHGDSPFEYYEAVLPRLKQLEKENPKTTITDLDITESALEYVLTGNLPELSHAGWPPTIPIVGTYMPAYKRLRELSEEGKKVCWITGNDKPRLTFLPKEQKFATYFQDISFTHGALSDFALSGFRPNVENFYYNQDIPEITIKQCLLIIKIISVFFKNQDRDTIIANKIVQGRGPNGSYIINVHSDFVKKILYPDWDNTIFQAEKPPNQGQGDGTGYHYYNSGLLEKRILDYAIGQINDWYSSIDSNLLLSDNLGRPRERFYNTEVIPIDFS
jgi:hypothetical protein